MDCPHCNVPLNGFTVCPRCKYDINKIDGGEEFFAWCDENDPTYVYDIIERERAREEAKQAEAEAIETMLRLAKAARRKLFNDVAIENGKHGYYEYKIISPYDENGKMDASSLSEQLTLLSAQGWHLVSNRSASIQDVPDAERISIETDLFAKHNLLCFEKYIEVN